MARSQTQIEQRPLSLDELLTLVGAGNFGLPDFQRPFVWEPEHVRRLLATVFMGWPAGLILLMEAPPSTFFSVRPLEGLEEIPGRMRHLILDGQQRVSALAHAFGVVASPKEPRWFLDLRAFEHGFATGDVEKAFVRLVGSPKRDEDRILVPLSALRSDVAFQSWRDRPSGGLLDDIPRPARAESNRAWLDLLHGLRNFRLPTTILRADMPLSAVATIFERLNTSGLRLDTFDLVVAHVYRDGRNLRAEWDRALYSRPVLRRFLPDDPVTVAELVAMVSVGDTRRAALLDLDPDLLWSSWDRAVSAMEIAARFLSDHAGIANAEQLPHRGILLAMAGAAFDLGELSADLNDLWLLWVFSRGLSERFNEATNTRVVFEYRALVAAAKGETLPSTDLSPADFMQATRRGNNSVWRSLLAMIRRQDPIDYPDGLLPTALSPDWARPIPLVRGTTASADPAVGFVLGSPAASSHLGHQKLTDIRDGLDWIGGTAADEFLRTQFLPALNSPDWVSPENFLAARARMIVETVRNFKHRHQSNQLLSSSPRERQVEDREGYSRNLTSFWLNADESGLSLSEPRLKLTLRLAHELLDGGHPQEAAAALQLYIEASEGLDPTSIALVRLVQGRALAQSGLSGKAKEVFVLAHREARRVGHESISAGVRASATLELGRLLVGQDRAEEALPLVDEELATHAAHEIQVDPMLLELALLRAQCLAALGDHRAANTAARVVLDGLFHSGQFADEDLIRTARDIIQDTDT